MALEAADLEQIKELIGSSISDTVKNSIQEITNKYDKAIDTKINKQKAPLIEELKTQIQGSMSTKKLAKLLRRLDDRKEAKENEKAGGGQGAGKSAAEVEAARVAAEAAAAAAAAGNKNNKKDDLFRKRLDIEHEERIKALEQVVENAKSEAQEAKKMSALDRAISDLPWANIESRDMARDFFAGKLKLEDDGEYTINGKPFADHIKTEVPSKFENLLAPVGKGGSGASRGTGKPGSIDIDAMSDVNSTPAQKAEAARAIANLLPHN